MAETGENGGGKIPAAPEVGKKIEPRDSRETVVSVFNSAFSRFEKASKNGQLDEHEQWAFKSIRDARSGTDFEHGKDTYTNEFFKDPKNPTEKINQEEGIPVEELLEFLRKEAEDYTKYPLESQQRKDLIREAHILYRQSQTYSEQHGFSGLVHNARLHHEANLISKDVRRTGSELGDWLKAEKTLMGRLELALPPPKVEAAPPTPAASTEAGTETPTEAAAAVAPPAVPAAEAAARPTEGVPVATVETVTPRAEPQPETLEQIRREFTFVNRTTDPEKRARELAELQLREEMRRGSGWNPLNWPRKIGLRMAEDYYRQLYTERARQAMLAANNSYLTMDVVRNAAVNATHGAAEAQAAGKAKIEQVKTGVSLEGQQVIEVEGELKNALIDEIIRPVVKGQITTEGEIQQKLREFVQSHQNDPQVKEVFGKDTSLYGRLAEYFATDLLEMGNLVKGDIAAHKYSVEQLGEFTKIRIANTSWAAETQASFNRWSDRAVRWAQQGRIRGAILNPVTIGALASVGTFLTLRAPTATRFIAPFAAPGVGIIAGAAFAAFRRNYDLKVDRAAHQTERTYSQQIPQGAPRREALERFAYNTASVNELINGGGQELLTGTARRSLQELLGQDLSDGQVTSRANVLRRVAEIKTRLDFSSREKTDLITFEAREQVEQGRLALVKEIVAARQTLRTAGMSDAEISQLETNFTGEWNSRLTQNREQQDRSFAHYRLRNAAGAAVFGGVAGLAGGFVTQEGFAQIARHLPEAANIPVIGGLFQKGETLREQFMREHGLKLPGSPQAPTAPPTPATGTLVETVETTNILSGPKTGVEANDITGHRTFIPKGTEWVRDPLDSNKWDLRVLGKPDKVLIEDARFDLSGKLVDWNHTTSQNSLFEVENSSQGTEVVKGAQAVSEWEKLKTPTHHREWYAYDKPGSQGNELRLYTAKDGDAVTLDMSKMREGFQKGLAPNPIDVQEIIRTQKSGFMFSIPGPDGELISAWVPDGADGAWDGKLRLDPNDATHFVEFNGKKMPLGEFSKMVLNQNALNPLPNGDIATELYKRQDVFNLGADGKMGFIEAGTLVDRPEGKVLQAFATIRGNGGVQVELPKGFVAEVTLKGPWVEEIKKLVPAPEAPLPQPIEGEAPPIIPIPFAPRHPLEPLGKPGETPPVPSQREPERGRRTEGETPPQAEQVIADQALSDQLTAARDELAGLQQGLAAAGVEPNLEQKAKLEQLQAEVERLQRRPAPSTPAEPGQVESLKAEAATVPVPAPVSVPPLPQPPVAGPVQPTHPAETAKQPWQMTREEAKQWFQSGPQDTRMAFGLVDPNDDTFMEHTAAWATREREQHRYVPNSEIFRHASVEKALSEGKPVPPEVLAEYPDLAQAAEGAVVTAPAPASGPAQPPPQAVPPVPAGPARPTGPPPPTAETPKAAEKKLASTIDQLPPLKEGFVRLVHLTQPNLAEEIVETGLDYSRQGIIDSTARAYGDASQAEYSTQDPRFNYLGVKAVILDVPEDQYKLYRSVSDPNNPGKVPAEYVVGVIDAYKPPPQPSPAPAGPAARPTGPPPPARAEQVIAEPALSAQLAAARNELVKTLEDRVAATAAPAPSAEPLGTTAPSPPKATLRERLAGIFGRRQPQHPAAEAQAAAEPVTAPPSPPSATVAEAATPPPVPAGPPARPEALEAAAGTPGLGDIRQAVEELKGLADSMSGRPEAPAPKVALSEETIQTLKGWVKTALQEQDPKKRVGVVGSLSSMLAADSSKLPQPVNAEEAKLAITEELRLLAQDEATRESIRTLLQENEGLRAALESLAKNYPEKEREPGIKVRQLRTKLNAQLVLRIIGTEPEGLQAIKTLEATPLAPPPTIHAEVAAEALPVEPAPPEQPSPLQRGEPLTPETVQQLKAWVGTMLTEEDPSKQGAIVQTLSSILQADSRQSPHPLQYEEGKALITEELLKLGEENLLNLLQKHDDLRKALVMLRDRDIPNIKNTSIILKALRSQANAQKILRLLDQKQPPESLSTRPQPLAQPPTGPLLTEKELEALERAREEVGNMGAPAPTAGAPTISQERNDVLDELLATSPLGDESETEALPVFPDYVEKAGEELGLTAEEKKALADTLKEDYFEDPIFKEEKTRIEQDRLEEILGRVIDRWHLLRFPEEGRDIGIINKLGELRSIRRAVDKIMLGEDDSVREDFSYQLFYALPQGIRKYSAGEIQAFIRAIEIMERTQSQKDNVNE